MTSSNPGHFPKSQPPNTVKVPPCPSRLEKLYLSYTKRASAESQKAKVQIQTPVRKGRTASEVGKRGSGRTSEFNSKFARVSGSPLGLADDRKGVSLQHPLALPPAPSSGAFNVGDLGFHQRTHEGKLGAGYSGRSP